MFGETGKNTGENCRNLGEGECFQGSNKLKI